MQLQFVYGNPRKVSGKRKKKTKRAKKKLASGQKSKNNNNDKGEPVAKRKKKARRKVKAKAAKRRTKKVKAKKVRKHKKRHAKKAKASKPKARRVKRHKRSKNPERVKLKGTNKVTGDKIALRWGMTRATRGEIAKAQALAKKGIADATIRKERAHGKPKKVKARIKRKAKAAIAREKKSLQRVAAMRRARRASLSHDDSQRALLKSKAYKVRGTKQVAASFSKKNKKSKKRNPIFGGGSMLDTVKRAATGGMDKYELGALALGGALYPITAAGLAKFAPAVYSKVAALNIPGGAGVGVNFLVGAAAYAIGERMGSRAAQSVGKGLIAAAAVGVAAVAGQWAAKQANLVPSVAPLAELPEGYGDADFGDADFGGVDYTMEGVDYTLEGQMGDDGADFGGVDYTMEGYGEIPEGMGEGQMG